MSFLLATASPYDEVVVRITSPGARVSDYGTVSAGEVMDVSWTCPRALLDGRLHQQRGGGGRCKVRLGRLWRRAPTRPGHVLDTSVLDLGSFSTFTLVWVIGAGFAWAILPRQSWRVLLLASTAPLALLLCVMWIVPESPYYLAAKGDAAGAAETLRRLSLIHI